MNEADVKDAEEFLESERKVNEEAEAKVKVMENMQAKRRRFLVELEEMKMNAIGEVSSSSP